MTTGAAGPASPSETTYLVLGAGGLGCPALLGLTGGGARRLIIVDDDSVEASNLQRQVLYTLADVGRPKVEAARQRLRARLPALEVETRPTTLDEARIGVLLDELRDRDLVVVECTDSPELKFALNDACVARGVPTVIAGVVGWRGQAMAVASGVQATACYRCLFEHPPPPDSTPTCAAVGVVGAAAGHLGYLAASLALSLAPSRGQSVGVGGRFIDVDLRTSTIRTLDPRPRRDCPACSGSRVRNPNQENQSHGNHSDPHPPAQIH